MCDYERECDASDYRGASVGMQVNLSESGASMDSNVNVKVTNANVNVRMRAICQWHECECMQTRMIL